MLETILIMAVGAFLGVLISEIYHKLSDIDEEYQTHEKELYNIIYDQASKIDSLEKQMNRIKMDIEAQK